MKFLNMPTRSFDQKLSCVEVWYDWISAVWTVQRKNATGDQLGDCEYAFHKVDALSYAREHIVEGVELKIFKRNGERQ